MNSVIKKWNWCLRRRANDLFVDLITRDVKQTFWHIDHSDDPEHVAYFTNIKKAILYRATRLARLQLVNQKRVKSKITVRTIKRKNPNLHRFARTINELVPLQMAKEAEAIAKSDNRKTA